MKSKLLLPDDGKTSRKTSRLLQLDCQGGQEKPAIQETCMGLRHIPAASPQSFKIST